VVYLGEQSGSDVEELVFSSLSHRIRRMIILTLGERGKRSFTELMEELGIDDTGTLTFHLRKLSGLITKTGDGYYTLTELGRRAYAILKSLRVSGEESKEVRASATSARPSSTTDVKPDLVVLSDRLSLRISRELLERVRATGRKLLVKDVVKVEVADDVDEDLFNEVVESIQDVVTLRVPKHLEATAQLKARDVLNVVSSKVRAPIPSIADLATSIVEPIVSTVTRVVTSVTPLLLTRVSKGGELLYSTSLDTVKSLELDIDGGSIKVSQGDVGKLEVYSSRFSRCDFDVDGEGGELRIDLRGCEAYVTLPRVALERIGVDLSGGILEVRVDEGVRVADLSLRGGVLRVDMGGLQDSGISIDLSGGFVEARLGYSEFKGVSRVSIDLGGGVVKLGMEVPKGTLVNVNREGIGGYADIDIDEELRRVEKSDRVVNVELDVSGGFAEISAKVKK
jgi:DNA-binding HxlR family transcriptional regulator